MTLTKGHPKGQGDSEQVQKIHVRTSTFHFGFGHFTQLLCMALIQGNMAKVRVTLHIAKICVWAITSYW